MVNIANGNYSSYTSEAIAYINGKRFVLPPGRGECTLLQFLRENGLTGTKLGCGEGGCGACTVMVSRYQEGRTIHRSVNACLCPLYAVDGMHVVTVEGIGSARDGLHPVQERLSKAHGSQCGFCTPGFVMSMYSLLRSAEKPVSEEDVEEALSGNLCRCTGYRPILDAFRIFAKCDPQAYSEEAIAAAKGLTVPDAVNGTPKVQKGGSICPSSGLPCDCKGPSHGTGVVTGANGGCGVENCCKGEANGSCGPRLPHNPNSPEPIFPVELKKRVAEALYLPGPSTTWYRPITLSQLLDLKQQFPDARLVGGNSEVGIEMKFKDAGYKTLVAVTHIKELQEISVDADGVHVGAGVTLTQLKDTLSEVASRLPAHQVRTCQAVIRQLRWFAGNQIRNVATLGGNICTASPISDLNPLWMCCGSVFTVVGAGQEPREVKASEFFLGYRRTALQPHEVLLSVSLPFNTPMEYVREFKQSPRREDDIAIVNSGMRVRFALPSDEEGLLVDEVEIAYGGVAPKSIMAERVMGVLRGKRWSWDLWQAALAALDEDINISSTAPGGRVEYRRSLAASFLFKFFLQVNQDLSVEPGGGLAFPLPDERWESAVHTFERPPPRGVQYYPQGKVGEVIGQPSRHMAADLQVSGEAQYTDDIPLPSDALHAALVYSDRPHARLISVDPTAALNLPGVCGYYDHRHVANNIIGPVYHDEEVFAKDKVTCVGQVVGIIVADTEVLARKAAKAVAITYEDLPPVMSCEEAIESNSFYENYDHQLKSGDVQGALTDGSCDHVLEGVVKLGGQEHFYLEPMNCIAVPHNSDEMLLVSSTQDPAKHQKIVASVLGIPMHKIVSKTKRLGGGFGGKETRAIYSHAACAVAAYQSRRPVRLCLDRDEDMQTTGQRHAFLMQYKVGFSSEGKILALDADLYNNTGNTMDLSFSVMDRAMMHADSCYAIPHMHLRGHLCRTHQASNTAFRGFGGPQGLMLAEMVVERVAKVVGKPSWMVRELNLQPEGYIQHYGQKLDVNRIPHCWHGVIESSQFHERVKEVEVFNKDHRWRKRGMSVMPTKFGISFTAKHLNQAGALVHIYLDGTVLVTHGGVEMGQGLHTKVAQVAAHSLGVPLDAVFIAETSSDKVPNASPTAASASSDMYGAAVLDACNQLNARLEPYRKKLSTTSMKQLATAAWLDRVDLSSHGFYLTPDVTGFGGCIPFNYYTFGAAVAEVELDTLTGDWHILRADIVMDVGQPLNPAIDIGQIEGGFIQGVGWSCLEELIWGDKQHPWVKPGLLFTRGPGTYKIPTANDMPLDFRATILKDSGNERAIHSSKAIGEPPFHLGATVYFALKEAVYAARAEVGLSGWFRLDMPATPERLRMACVDDITRRYGPDDLLPKISC